eukprot:768364-Hanusia_phi.AAC.3
MAAQCRAILVLFLLSVSAGGGRMRVEMSRRSWMKSEDVCMEAMTEKFFSGHSGRSRGATGEYKVRGDGKTGLAGGGRLRKLQLRGGGEDDYRGREGRGAIPPRKRARNAGNSISNKEFAGHTVPKVFACHKEFLDPSTIEDLVERIGNLTFSFLVNDRAEVFQANITGGFDRQLVEKMVESTSCVTQDVADEIKTVECLDVLVLRSGCFRLCSRGGSFLKDCPKAHRTNIETLKTTEILLFISVTGNIVDRSQGPTLQVLSCDSDGEAKDIVYQCSPASGMALYLANSSRLFWEITEVPCPENQVQTDANSAQEDRLQGVLVAHALIRHCFKKNSTDSVINETGLASSHISTETSFPPFPVQDRANSDVDFIHPSYMIEDNKMNIRKCFARDSAVLLHDFIAPPLYDIIWKGWDLLPWKDAGPRNRRFHQEVDRQTLQSLLTSKEVKSSTCHAV